MIEQILESALSINIAVEQLRTPALTTVFKAFSALGDTKGYLALAPLIFWFISPQKGFRLLYLMMFCFFTNVLLKEIFQLPRPFESGAVTALTAPGGFSFPSGHAQMAMFFWLYVSLNFKKAEVILISTLMILGIGLSRVYLGVHYPTDVIAGWLVGAIVAATAFSLHGRIDRMAAYISPLKQLSLSCLASALMIFLLGLEKGVLISGIPGLFLGVLLVDFQHLKSLQNRLANAGKIFLGLTGISLTLGIYTLLGQWTSTPILNCLRFTLVGVLISGLIPYVFLTLRKSVDKSNSFNRA